MKADSSCVFCQIAAGASPASLVLDEPHVLAMMDIAQSQPGQAVVFPRAHHRDIRSLEEVEGAALMTALVRVARALARAFDPDGMNVSHAIGVAAGQEIEHAHFIIRPRREGDGVSTIFGEPTWPERAELDRQAASIKGRL